LKDNEAYPKSDWAGGAVGILVFLGGIGLLVLTFSYAFQMFAVEPAQAVGVEGKAPVDFGRVGESFVGVIGRVLLLLVMSFVSSVIANRGIRLYAESRGHVPRKPARPKPPKETEPQAETTLGSS
jgi:hypothetical protein